MIVPIRHLPDGPAAVILVGPRRRELLVDPDIAARLRGAVIVECGGQPVRQFTRAGRKCRENVSRMVCPAPPSVRVRRRNGNPFDCRRSNLFTSCGYVGFAAQNVSKQWRAQVKVGRRRYFIGYWPTKQWALDVCQMVEPVARELREGDFTPREIRRRLRVAAGLDVEATRRKAS